ncbi:MAG: hypothetical protein JSS66_01545 [Armatimonadetes bacterium]|nr:hypothetical protein [Armatimonadota bacterium]
MLGLLQFSSLLADFDRGEYQVPELMGIGLIPTAIALVLFAVGVKLQFAGKPKWIKWLSTIVLAIGVFVGLTPFQEFFFDPIYKQLYPGGNKVALMHAAGIIIPVVGLIAMFVWNYFLNRNKFEEL